MSLKSWERDACLLIIVSSLFIILSFLSAAASYGQIVFSDGFESGDFRAWAPDLDGPKILELKPLDGSALAGSEVVVSAVVVDLGAYASDLDLESLVFELDGEDRSHELSFEEDEVTWSSSPLPDGIHRARLEAADQVGNVNVAEWSFTLDTEPPVMSYTGPEDFLLRPGEVPSVEVQVTDSGTGLPPGALRALWDDEPAPCFMKRSALKGSAPLKVGVETFVCRGPEVSTSSSARLDLRADDLAGNTGHLGPIRLRFQVDAAPPVLTVDSPAEGAWVKSPLRISGTVADDVGVSGVRVSGVPVEAEGGSWELSLELSDGRHSLLVSAMDTIGRETHVPLAVRVDNLEPTLRVDQPVEGTVVHGAAVQVSGSADDLHSDVRLLINGGPVELQAGGAFTAEVPLSGPETLLSIVATDSAGNEVHESRSVHFWSLPEVSITSPSDLTLVSGTEVTVEGVVGEGATVVVNGVPAEVNGRSFFVHGVPVADGGNAITAIAEDTAGHVSADSVYVVRDTGSPRVSIYRPSDGSHISEPEVLVAGLVNDVVSGTVNLSEVAVTVNGISAEVINRSFAATVPLKPGSQTLRVEAVDMAGNRAEAAVDVVHRPGEGARLLAQSGGDQTGEVGSELPEPLTVRAVDEVGQGVPNVSVIFSVEQGGGKLAPSAARRVVVVTGADGSASTRLILGSRAGAHNHVVSAQAPGWGLPVLISASASPGSPHAVIADSGMHQTGVAGRTLPRPLMVTVTDRDHNRLGGVPVVFRVQKGRGTFIENDRQEHLVMTDSDGRAAVNVRLDPSPGAATTVVSAEIDGTGVLRATFVGSGVGAGPAEDTAITGLVLDNTGDPIQGVTARVLESGQSTVTDSAGSFFIEGVPVGAVHLEIDGSTAVRPGVWPTLEYFVVTLPGNTIDVGMPIHLLPLDVESGVFIDADTGATLEVPGIPGFRLDIVPGSVTFPDGGQSGRVSVTAVHHDRIPMTPGFGQQPRLIVTIQPAGAVFDPPAGLTLPNVENLAPGSVTDLYSFDHDLGQFVSIGPASVSPDGLEIVSDPGVGILKAGWHCGGNPSSSGTPHGCGSCATCDGSTCVPGCPADPGAKRRCQSASCRDSMCFKRQCAEGECRETLRSVKDIIVTIDGTPTAAGVVEPTGKPTPFAAQIDHDCDELSLRWSFQPELPDIDAGSQSFSAVLQTHGSYRGKLVAQCKECPGSGLAKDFAFTAFEVESIFRRNGQIAPILRGSLSEKTYPYIGIRKTGAIGKVEVTTLPRIEPAKLSEELIWTGAGQSEEDLPTIRTYDLGDSTKLVSSVDVPNSDGRHRRTVWTYVVTNEPAGFSPENGKWGNSFPDFPCGFATDCGFLTGSGRAFWHFAVKDGNHIETGVVPPYISPDGRIAMGARAEVRFQMKPKSLLNDFEQGLIERPSIGFRIYQDERSCALTRSGETWTYSENESSPEWQGDGCCDNKDDTNPWDGEGHLHSTDPPAWNEIEPGNTGVVFKLNLRTWVRCSISPADGNSWRDCGDYLYWRTELWTERDPESGEVISPESSNLVAEGNEIWGLLPEGAQCLP